MMRTRISTLLLGAVAITALPSLAEARKNPLAGQPMVRHKMELRLKRFEVAPTFEASVQADYQHTLSGGLKAEYHLTDNLSFGGVFFFGGGIDTALASQIRDSLPETQTPGDPTPDRDDFNSHLNSIPIHGGVHATFTPWFGKMALFGKAFVNFDMYLTGGLAFAMTKNPNEDPDLGTGCTPTIDDPAAEGNARYNDPRNDPPCNSGFRPGIQLGAGMHVFVNKWVAIDFSFRNYMFTDNPSGLDFTGDLKVDEDDQRFMSHLFFGVGVSLFLPPKIKISK